MGRILGIDYGKKRLGLAFSDPTKTIASPFKMLLANKNHMETIKNLLEEIKSYEIEAILIGLPLHLSNLESKLSYFVRQFGKALEEESQIPVIYWDERLTSKQVEKVLIEGAVKRKKRKQSIDVMSAILILQSYLDRTRGNPHPL